MKFTIAAAALLVAGASATAKNVTYTTEIVSQFVTYCPEPTQITHGGVTYTITKPTTLTITNCPCTVTKPVLTTTVSKCHDCVKPTTAPYNNGTTTAAPPPVQPTGTLTSKPPSFTGAAARAAPGGLLAAALGFAAYVL